MQDASVASEEENCFTATLLKHMRPSLKSLRPSGSECGSYLAEPVPVLTSFSAKICTGIRSLSASIRKILRICACVILYNRIYEAFVQACVVHIQYAYLQPPISEENAGPQPEAGNSRGHFGYGCWKDGM